MEDQKETVAPMTAAEALAAARELGKNSLQAVAMPTPITPRQVLNRIFALATFAKHRNTNHKKSKHNLARSLRAKARMAKR